MKKTKKIKDEKIYECDSCGATATRPQVCCGEPMKKKSELDSEDFGEEDEISF